MKVSYQIFVAAFAGSVIASGLVHEPRYQAGADLPNFKFDELFNMTKHFFDTFIYPANAKEARKINSTLFSEHVLGRVDATRDINGRELNTEYAFGLWASIALNPDLFTLLGVPQAYKLVRFAGNQNIVSASAIVDFNITALSVVNPVELIVWFTFNAKKQITQYDATFRYLQFQFDDLYERGENLFGVGSVEGVQNITAPILANSICETTQKYCTGANRQYKSLNACQKHLTFAVRFGAAYELGENTLLCRMVHAPMVPLRPSVHCPHVGPTGGGYCDDNRQYAAVVTEPLFKHQPFIPYGYQNKNKTIAEM